MDVPNISFNNCLGSCLHTCTVFLMLLLHDSRSLGKA
jgi:hypothetical protein